MNVHSQWRIACIGTLVLGFAGGCGSNDQPIGSYLVEKPGIVYESNHVSPPDRTLAAIIIWQQTGWFFKLTGPHEMVNQQRDTFLQWIQSVRFADNNDATPDWAMPSGWQRQPGSGIRYATLVIPSDEPRLEVTVTPLQIAGQVQDQYVLENINRWRKELGLSPIRVAQLSDHTVLVDLEATKAWVMDVAGRRMAGRMPGNVRPPLASPAAGPVSGESQLSYEVPTGWSRGEPVVSRGGVSIRFEAAFEVVSGAEHLDIRVSKFPVAMAQPLLNVNRWRQQLDLPPMSEVELSEAFRPDSVGGSPAQRIEIRSAAGATRPEMILGVLTSYANEVYFTKLKGDQELAERERMHFDEFVRSVRFLPTDTQ